MSKSQFKIKIWKVIFNINSLWLCLVAVSVSLKILPSLLSLLIKLFSAFAFLLVSAVLLGSSVYLQNIQQIW
jgi:hypothetical protein